MWHALQISAKSGMLPLPWQSTTVIASWSASSPSAEKTNGQRDLLRASLDEHHRACEEHLGALGVELRDHPERLLPRQRLRLQERRAGPLVVAHEHELVELVDAEKDRRVGGVEDLVAAAAREGAQQPVQVALRRRAEVELRLLDQDHEAAHARLDERGEGANERQSAVLGALAADDADRALRRRVGRCEQRRRSQVGREEQRVRRPLAVQVQRLGRLRVEEQRAAADDGFHVHPLLAA